MTNDDPELLTGEELAALLKLKPRNRRRNAPPGPPAAPCSITFTGTPDEIADIVIAYREALAK